MDPVITWDSRIFYGALAVIVFFLSYAAERTNRKIFVLLLVSLLVFVAGFRADTVGRDTEDYVKMFELVHSGGTSLNVDVQNGVNIKDPGFGLICYALSLLVNHPTVMLLFCASIIYPMIILRFWELRHQISFGCATFAFYCICFFESMNAMRQYCAVAVIFWGTRYLVRKKYAPFIVTIILATVSFHKSAIIGLLYIGIELFSWKNLSVRQKKFLKRMIFLGVVFSFLIIAYLTSYLAQYFHYLNVMNVDIGLRLFALIFIFVTSLFLYKQSERSVIFLPSKTQGQKYLLQNVRIYYLLSCAAGFWGYIFQFVGRIAYYFNMFWFVYFGLLVRERRQIPRWILKALVYAVTLYVLGQYLFTHNGAWQHPYHFVWST